MCVLHGLCRPHTVSGQTARRSSHVPKAKQQGRCLWFGYVMHAVAYARRVQLLTALLGRNQSLPQPEQFAPIPRI